MPAAPAVSIPDQALDIALALALALTLAAAASLATGRLARRWLTAVGRPHIVTDPLIPGTIRIIRLVTFLVALAVFAFPALDLAGADLRVGLESQQMGRWAATTGIR